MKIANTEYNTLGAYKLLMDTLHEKPLETITEGSNKSTYVFFNKKKEIAMLNVSEVLSRRGYYATISVCTVRKSATEGYFVKELGKMNLRSSKDNKDALHILNLELDYLYRGNHYATRMASVALELAAKQGYKYLITYAPKDPIISFKNINNKISQNPDLGDRTELFFKSCGFKDIGTYTGAGNRGESLRVYARTASRPLKVGIERESKFISTHISEKIEKHGELAVNATR